MDIKIFKLFKTQEDTTDGMTTIGIVCLMYIEKCVKKQELLLNILKE
jgi:hypothetical protein